MATLISSATGNFTAAATWKVADATSLQYALTGTTVCTTSFVNSTSFIPGAITVDGFGVYASSTSLAPPGLSPQNFTTRRQVRPLQPELAMFQTSTPQTADGSSSPSVPLSSLPGNRMSSAAKRLSARRSCCRC